MVAQGLAWLAGGRISVHVARAFPLERGAEAHRSIEAGRTTGKLVLSVAD